MGFQIPALSAEDCRLPFPNTQIKLEPNEEGDGGSVHPRSLQAARGSAACKTRTFYKREKSLSLNYSWQGGLI